MQVTIENKPALTVAGLKAPAIDSSECPTVWDRLYAKYDDEQIASLGPRQDVGVCVLAEGQETIDYMAGFLVDNADQASQLDMTIWTVEAATYALVPIKGAVPSSIHQAWKYLLEVFFPETGYRHSGAPDFEIYKTDGIHSEDYEMELWIPIVQ